MDDERTLQDCNARAANRMRLRALALMLLLAASVVLAACLSFAWPRNLVVSVLMLVPLALPVAGIVRSRMWRSVLNGITRPSSRRRRCR